ncbi:MAG: polysaccharide biosynthesis tyrosine autokinase [bacterium]|nr:polysaccharide biosynthesis tyrosine autokinase [bacterium]
MRKSEVISLDTEFHLERYWNVVKSRRYILLICILMALAIGLWKSFTAVPMYRARGVLMIAPEQEGVISFNERYPFTRPNVEYFNTWVRILKSQTLAKEVIEVLSSSTYQELPTEVPIVQLGGTPGMAGRISRFLNSLDVNPMTETQLVEVTFTSRNPEEAARVLNTLFEKYINFNRELKSQSTRQTSVFIAQQIKDLEQNLAQKEEELQSYSKSKDLYYLTNEQNADVNKFTDYTTAHTAAQITRINRESNYLEMKNKAPAEFHSVRTSALLNNLKEDLSTQESTYKRRSQIMKENYPLQKSQKSQIETLKLQIEEASKNIAAQSLSTAKAEYEAALKQERSLRRLLTNQKKDMSDSNSSAIHYKSLSIEVENMRNLLNFLDRKRRETILSSSNREGAEMSNIKIIDPANVPRIRISPRRKMIMMMALILGIGSGLGLIFLLDFIDHSVKSPDEAEALVGAPLLGVVPASSAKKTDSSYARYYYAYREEKPPDITEKEEDEKDIEMINFFEPTSSLADCYRNIRTSLLLTHGDKAPGVIMVSSARPEEGKTVTAINMAIAFRQLGKKVLLIDSDMRKPRIHKVFQLDNTLGLSTYLEGKSDWQEVIQETTIDHLSILPAGPIPYNPVELLSSEAMTSLVKEKVLSKFDYVLLDTPPFVEIADPLLLGKLSDGVIMVTWCGRTNRNLLNDIREHLEQYDIPILGMVLNKVDPGSKDISMSMLRTKKKGILQHLPFLEKLLHPEKSDDQKVADNPVENKAVDGKPIQNAKANTSKNTKNQKKQGKG